MQSLQNQSQWVIIDHMVPTTSAVITGSLSAVPGRDVPHQLMLKDHTFIPWGDRSKFVRDILNFDSKSKADDYIKDFKSSSEQLKA